MKYLYSRMLAGDSEPVKPKKRTKAPKPPKPVKIATPKTTTPPARALPSVPKPLPTPANRPAIANQQTHPAIKKPTPLTTPKTAHDVDRWRSEPTGSNRAIVVPPPINLFNTPASAAQKKVDPTKSKVKTAKKAKLTSTTEDTTTTTTTTKTKTTATTTAAAAAGTTQGQQTGTKSKVMKTTTAKAPLKSTTVKSKAPSTTGGRKRTIDTDDEDEPVQRKVVKSRRKHQILPILSGAYKLATVFKGHTDINVPVKDRNDHDMEDAKDIWCCEFEPRREGQLENSNTVALCGSYSVLLLDTQQKRYTKKYTHSEIQEIFYCMAWTTLAGSELLNTHVVVEGAVGNQASCNILAIAGRLGSIKLLNPLQNECYRYLFGHDKAVLKLAFAKSEPRWLLSASADKTVRLWDIGSPMSKTDDSVCLARFSLPPRTGVPSALSISYDLSTLVVGFDNGDMVSFQLTDELLQRFRERSMQYRSKESRTGDKWTSFGALATVQPQHIYPKGGEWHAGYVDDVYIFGQDGDTTSKLYNRIISRGAEDMEFIVWNPEKSTETDADIQLSLAWPDSKECTGVRYKVIEAEGQKVLVAGEYDGQVYIYDVGNSKKSKTLADNSVEKSEPTRILSHSKSSELIRDVCCSNDTRTIVAVDNNNTVFVWNNTEN
ncbi:WD40-repeat-containing domain protein [Mucor mucedo]|uniref:WD40-repeat-containing domain protein n=1 Tax=Mucor mucedo TaxID=29922 RepID=UPI00221FDBFD|nr:WD40-repeat-containing domain protein [Mucor mucedo]KAI7873331.1 WD40-repeat-containing domain protein [Mucor mucedo]